AAEKAPKRPPKLPRPAAMAPPRLERLAPRARPTIRKLAKTGASSGLRKPRPSNARRSLNISACSTSAANSTACQRSDPVATSHDVGRISIRLGDVDKDGLEIRPTVLGSARGATVF